MIGRCRWGAQERGARRAVLAGLLAAATMLGSFGMGLPQPARAQDAAQISDETWVDPAADSQWDDISDDVDQTISEVWSEGTTEGEWVDPALATPSYDANGNMIDPVTGQALAIGADGNPIDAAAGLYFDEYGNIIDPATGMAVSWDENGQRILIDPTYDTGVVDGTEGQAVPEEVVPELETTPWLAPPPSGPPPGFANWNPPRTVFIPETGQSIDGVFLDAWRAWGGVTSWGRPLTPEFQEDGVIVQYYDYGRFEYHPEDPEGVVVHFGDLGRQMQPFLLRRASGSGSAGANEAALAARAWAPLDADSVRPDSDLWHFVPETGHAVAGEFKAFWEASGGVGYLGNPLTEPYKIDGITNQVFENGKLAQRAGEAPEVVPIGKMMVERWRLDTTPILQGETPVYSEELFTPPPMTTLSGAPVDPYGEKWVSIDISLQYLWAYQGDQVLWQGYISTGTAKFATPTGTYHVLSKIPSQTMEGVLGGEYYNVPDVPDVMYFTDYGHALHGTYWHSNFGTPMSHGCVNLPTDVAQWMYQWSTLGMRVEIIP